MADDRPDPVPRIQKVVPLEGKRLWLTLNTGSELLLNMSNRLNTTRFYPLNDDRVFCSVSTDGFSLHFCVEDNYAGSAPDLRAEEHRRCAGTQQQSQ